jgi:hypothetical protein
MPASRSAAPGIKWAVRTFSTPSRPALRAACGRPSARQRRDGHRGTGLTLPTGKAEAVTGCSAVHANASEDFQDSSDQATRTRPLAGLASKASAPEAYFVGPRWGRDRAVNDWSASDNHGEPRASSPALTGKFRGPLLRTVWEEENLPTSAEIALQTAPSPAPNTPTRLHIAPQPDQETAQPSQFARRRRFVETPAFLTGPQSTGGEAS